MDKQPRNQTAEPEPPKDDLQAMLRPTGGGGRSPLTMVLAAVALVAIGFIGGIFVGKSMGTSSQPAAFPGGAGQNGPAFGNGGAPNGGNGSFTLGTIQSIDGDTITIQTTDGSTVKVTVGGDTQIRITKDGSIGDLAEGTTIVVSGSRAGDTLAATSISEANGFGVPGAAASPSG